MKKEFNLSKLFYAFAIAFSVVTLSSCDNDDNSPLPPPSTGDVAGAYNGKVLITQVTPLAGRENAGEGETPKGQDVNATVKNDTVFFDKLPVDDLIISIIGDKDKAEAIIKAIGDVKYKVGYKPALNTEKDSIYLAFEPKPLILQLPSATEGEKGQTVTVTISSPEKGSFAYKNNQLKMKLVADEIELADVVIPTSKVQFDFDMTKKK
ncbi:DUF4840 domain-containing protein [Bacteroides hominis]|uniref:DUF4840 domain-containing protein n=1 Tax=Bacteroides hominis TaxID=2763023 RepID=UPI002276686A|nr:DUF4840 domain-containing protein [Bacteroides fragilis]MCY2671950.1 DUF4840 domain-containing protein [Bacteroides fragilis]MDA1494474.1 DUF4840 domain-containing protein [Bacteroides fragilis]